MSVRLAVAERPRRETRTRDHIRTAVLTTPGGRDRHRHCAVFIGETGNGWTDTAADGHRHRVSFLDVLPSAGHGHELSAERCQRDHAWQHGDEGRHL